MKRSRSGTASPPERRRLGIALTVAALVALAFVASFVLGIRDRREAAAPVVNAETPEMAPSFAGLSRVEVLNGAGKPGLARLATDQLRSAGFDVVQFGNARAVAETSSVLDRVGNSKIALAVAKTLGITAVKTAIDSSRYVDATVILGRDWENSRTR